MTAQTVGDFFPDCYLIMTPAEIWLSALGLSLVTALSPSRMTSRMVGLWFGAIAIGHGLGGVLGLLWSRWPYHRYFASIAGLSLVAAALLCARLGALQAALPGAQAGYHRPRA